MQPIGGSLGGLRRRGIDGVVRYGDMDSNAGPLAVSAPSMMEPEAKTAGAPDDRMAADELRPARAQAPVHVRKEFADAAVWQPRLETDAQGIAQVEFIMPEI